MVRHVAPDTAGRGAADAPALVLVRLSPPAGRVERRSDGQVGQRTLSPADAEMLRLQDRVFEALSSLSVHCHTFGMTSANDFIERMALGLASHLREAARSDQPDRLRAIEGAGGKPAPRV